MRRRSEAAAGRGALALHRASVLHLHTHPATGRLQRTDY